jgi:thymidylate kinase
MSQKQRRHVQRPPTVALIGPDGSGKSTIAQRVAAALPVPARYLYMGVNLESSSEMLPTTRLILSAKRRRGQRPDMTARVAVPSAGRTGARATVRGVLRIGAWVAEEWYRALLAARARRRGEVVIFDRHFFCDYYASDVRPAGPGEGESRRPLASRIHGTVLRRWYPRPDATLLLDAPAEVLLARKGEGTLESIEQRRADYRALADVLPAFAIVDADRSIDVVVADIVERVEALVAGPAVAIEPISTGALR